MDEKAIHEALVGQFGEKIVSADLEVASPFAVVATEAIVEVAEFSKTDSALAMDNLMCLSGAEFSCNFGGC